MNEYINLRRMLADDESVKIFDARIEYMRTGMQLPFQEKCAVCMVILYTRN